MKNEPNKPAEKTLEELFKECFPDSTIAGTQIENYEIKDKSKFTQGLLTNILRDLEEGNDKYQRLRISAEWNPTQTVEVEPPEGDPTLRASREVKVEPLRK